MYKNNSFLKRRITRSNDFFNDLLTPPLLLFTYIFLKICFSISDEPLVRIYRVSVLLSHSAKLSLTSLSLPEGDSHAAAAETKMQVAND